MATGESNALVIAPVGTVAAGPVTVPADERVTIGRSRSCGVHIEDPHVSKEHAEVWCRDGAWYVTDLASHNGTFINRWQLAPHDPMILHDGDVMAVGPRRFEVRLVSEAREPSSGSWATRASIFLRLRDERRPEQELAWEEFRTRYAPVILGFSRNAGLRTQDADDVLQDVMLGFFRLASEFVYDPSKGRFRGYLKRATLNAIHKRARRAERGHRVSEALLDEKADTADAHWEEQWAEQILARALDEARRRFDAQTLEAFELYARRGVAAEEVARRLDMSVNGVHQAKSRVVRLVRAIADRLRADEG